MGEAESAALAAIEIQKASMVEIAGYSVNIWGLILTVFFGVFLIALWRAQNARKLDWLDLLTRDGTKVSMTKILQMVGGVVGTWIIVKITLQGALTWDLFAIYLGYVASVDGFSKLIMAKYGSEGSDDSSVPYRGDYGRGSYAKQRPYAGEFAGESPEELDGVASGEYPTGPSPKA